MRNLQTQVTEDDYLVEAIASELDNVNAKEQSDKEKELIIAANTKVKLQRSSYSQASDKNSLGAQK